MLAEVHGEPSHAPDHCQRQFDERGAPGDQAILSSDSRDPLLPGINVPALVIHGDMDPLLPLEHVHDTARLIPGATLEVIEGMGHNLPPQLSMRLTTLIGPHARAADMSPG